MPLVPDPHFQHAVSMSKSLKRVRAALESAKIETEIIETPLARTAADAATAIGCEIDQIAKSIIFRGERSSKAILFLTAGGNSVDTRRAAVLAGEPLCKADAALVRAQTGFTIGGVAPVGHINQIASFADPKLLKFSVVWAAAGTPHHVFCVSPADLMRLSRSQVSDFTMTL